MLRKFKLHTPAFLGLLGLTAIYFRDDYNVVDAVAAATKTAPSQPPSLSLSYSIKPKTLKEGETEVIKMSVYNPWTNNTVSISATPTLPGAQLSQNGTQATWTWKVPLNYLASHKASPTVQFVATFTQNNGTATQLGQSVKFTLGENQPPSIQAISSQDATVGVPLRFKVIASDPDDDKVSISGQSLPNGASLSPAVLTGSQWVSSFQWTPKQADSETTTSVTFKAVDNFVNPAQTTEDVSITVHPASAENNGIKTLKIGQAVWDATASTLTLAGQVMLKQNATLPANLNLRFMTTGNQELPLSVTQFKPNGKWSLVGSLTSDQVPCTIKGQLSIDGTDTNTPATRVVKRAPYPCAP